VTPDDSALTRPRGRRAPVLLSLLAVLAPTGCSGADASLGPGPLGAGRDGADGWEVCAPFYPSAQYALGLDVLSNPGHQDAVLSGVELVDNDRFTVEDALLVPVDHLGVGVGEWPPARADPGWMDAAVPLNGAVVPAGADKSHELVLHLSVPAGQSATLRGWRIRYHLGGAPYEVGSDVTFRVRPTC
jgi:hypothetical protein